MKPSTITSVPSEQEAYEKDDSLRNDWETPTQYGEFENVQSAMSVRSEHLDDFDNPPITSAVKESVKTCFHSRAYQNFRTSISRHHLPPLTLTLTLRSHPIRPIRATPSSLLPYRGPIHRSIPSWTMIRAYETHLFSFTKGVA